MKKSKVTFLAVLALGLILITIGAVTGDYESVFGKATRICFECVGIG